MIKNRSIVLAIIFSILTCGIYYLYWFVCMTDDVNLISNHKNDTSGGKALLFSIITCGIYFYYWSYKMGCKLDEADGNSSGNRGILFLILSIFGLSIVNDILIQDSLNKRA